jgi:hypothetical protein
VTPFELVHVFPDIAPRDLLALMTSPTHQQLQDSVGKVERRDLISRVSDDAQYRCECMVYPARKIPAYVRPLLGGGLECHEIVSWDKATEQLEIDVHPAVLGGRSRVRATVTVVADGTSTVRTYRGEVTVQVRLIGARVEKAIVEEMTRTMTAAAEATRDLLKRRVTTA